MAKTILYILAAFIAGILLSQFFVALPIVQGAPSGVEHNSPSNYIHQNQINVYEDYVLLNVSGAQWANFADTNSMDPLFDTEAHALQFIPQSPEDISVGDIISYTTKQQESRIIHRVIFKGQDDSGIYFITQGDNNVVSDPGKVRFEQIERVLFAIIY